jgi:hypothetical protein
MRDIKLIIVLKQKFPVEAIAPLPSPLLARMTRYDVFDPLEPLVSPHARL